RCTTAARRSRSLERCAGDDRLAGEGRRGQGQQSNRRGRAAPPAGRPPEPRFPHSPAAAPAPGSPRAPRAGAPGNPPGTCEGTFGRRGEYETLLFEGRWLRSGEMLERAARLAGGLTDLGVAPGERVVVSMANCPEVSLAYQAVWRAGAVVTPAMFLLSVED